jgi:non-lysosomal glucosylceramidase
MKTSLKQTYGPNATALAFPLGGIGTGNVSLGIGGNFCDWEIFNHPGKGVINPNSFFAIRVKEGRKPPVCKILEGPVLPPYLKSNGYQPYSVAGLPHFRNARFFGEYPLVKIDFDDPDIPLKISLEAFTPLIPLQTEDSGLPCAILTYSIKNISSNSVSISLVGSLMNPIGEIKINSFGSIIPDEIGQSQNDFRDADNLRGIFFSSERYQPEELKYGNLSLVTNHPTVTYKRAWLRAGWFDYLREFWNDFRSDGLLQDLAYDTSSPTGTNDTASLGIIDELQPGERRDYKFILSWYFPNRPKSWKQGCSDKLIRNHYALKFKNSWDVAQYVNDHLDYLEDKTHEFHRSLYRSTLPPYVKDALSANIVPLRSTTCFWHEDGNFYGYEGCGCDRGCCDGTCTHVWSYAHTLAYLFPDLERNMRLNEFTVETEASGYMYFRSYQKFGEHFIWDWGNQKPEAAIDGQMGSVLRVLREWRMSGDIQWLNQVWKGVKLAIQYASDHWDTDKDGLPDGRQHNTYDIEFYGPNPLGTAYYLAGLRAAEELAKVMGENDLAVKYHKLFVSGSQKADSLLWNGEYYIQKLNDVNKYKYQFGLGCLSDQLLGQLHAKILNLGYILPPDHVTSAIKAIYHYNFKKNFYNHQNCQRTYIFNDEAGLILCSWPNGGEPKQPFVYSDEVWTGIEYEIASLLIYEGMVEEGFKIVKAIRERHDGIRRNPWNEVECGNHYARSMASWGLLLALSGFQYDVQAQEISFKPVYRPEKFRCLFTAGHGWGSYSQQFNKDIFELTLDIAQGPLCIRSLILYPPKPFSIVNANIDSHPIPVTGNFQLDKVVIQFDPEVILQENVQLVIKLT